MERLTLDDMIKALKCVASQDAVGDCYADHENFMHRNDKHKRIVCETGEDLRDYISGKEAVGCPYYQQKYGCCFEDGELFWLKDVAELLEELKSYKEAEEQGLLVRLPCKVGDDLYCIVNGKVKKLKVHSFGVPDFEIIDIEFKYVDGFKIVRFVGEVGKTVFLTRKEAEKKVGGIQKMKFKEFTNWCNERACDGRWRMLEAIACIKLINEVMKIQFWKREKIWKENYEQQVLEEIINPIEKKLEVMKK